MNKWDGYYHGEEGNGACFIFLLITFLVALISPCLLLLAAIWK